MIKKSLLAALTYLLLYCVLISLVQPTWSKTFSYSQQNSCIAQRYLYQHSSDQKVLLLGSSLTTNLERFLPPTVASLGLIGYSPADGLEIIDRAGHPPQLVLLEVNRMFRWPHREFLDDVLRPGLRQVRGVIPAMRTEYQPLNLLLPLLTYEPETSVATPSHKRPAAVLRPGIERALGEQKYIVGIGPLFSILTPHCESLRARGIQIGFFEVPEEPTVYDSAQAELMRRQIRQQFPDYPWIPLPTSGEYVTSEGEHLTPESARKFADYISLQSNLLLRGTLRSEPGPAATSLSP